jgi:hypothetical protein
MVTETSVGFNFFVSFIPPFTFALTMTVLYLFIFELNRIKILLEVGSGGEDFSKKLKQLQIIRVICIFLTFLAVILVAVNNFNFSLPEED